MKKSDKKVMIVGGVLLLGVIVFSIYQGTEKGVRKKRGGEGSPPPQSPKDICEKGGISTRPSTGGIWREYTQLPSSKNDGGWCDYGTPNPKSQLISSL